MPITTWVAPHRRRRRQQPNAQAKGLTTARSDARVPLLERDGTALARLPSTEGANCTASQGIAVNLSGKPDSGANTAAFHEGR